MKKSEKFYEILRNAGITEYWASKDFDPDADIATGNMLLPTSDDAVLISVEELFNGEINEDFCPSLIISSGEKGSNVFNALLRVNKSLVRREV